MTLLIERPADAAIAGLALEEVLLEHAPPEPVLFLWSSSPCVVIGKNQVAWQECRPGWLRRARIALARRVSGGGCVYHDPGNLNFSLVMPRTGYAEARVQAAVLDTLARLGLRGELRDRGAVFAGGGKCTGQAFCFRSTRVLHHGTFLVHADLNRLRAAVQPCRAAFTSRAIASRPAPVVNLADLVPGLTLAEVSAQVAAAFGAAFGALSRQEPRELTAHSAINKITERLHSWEWRFGYGPECTLQLTAVGEDRPTWVLEVRQGALVALRAAQGNIEIQPLSGLLRGCLLTPEAIAARLRAAHESSPLVGCLHSAGF